MSAEDDGPGRVLPATRTEPVGEARRASRALTAREARRRAWAAGAPSTDSAPRQVLGPRRPSAGSPVSGRCTRREPGSGSVVLAAEAAEERAGPAA